MSTAVNRRHCLSIFAAAVLAVAMSVPGRGDTFPAASSLVPREATPDLHPVVVIDRTDIELSGMRNLWDLLEGRDDLNAFGLHRPLSLKIVRLWSIGGYRAAVLINGRRITETNYDLDAIPLEAVERIEISRDSAVVAQGPEALTGVVNIVLRNRFEGAEVETSGERPVHGGGETGHVSAIWGGAWGGGHLTLGFDVFRRNEIRRADRSYSRASWTPGGSFADTSGVSIAGNTAVTFGPDGPTAQSVGDCQGSEFTGPLRNPLGLRGEGCGFGWGNREWSWERRDRRAAFAFLEHPVGADGTLYAEARLATTDLTKAYWAPTAGQFAVPAGYSDVLPNGGLLLHRFAGNGDRSAEVDTQEHDLTLGLKGEVAAGVGYDVHVRTYYNRNETDAGTYIRESTFLEEIGPGGRYDLENPLSGDADHLEAVRRIAVRLDDDTFTKHQAAHVVFDGTAFVFNERPVLWAAGGEFTHERQLWRSLWRDGEGDIVDPVDVVGWFTIESDGERDRLSQFAEVAVPLMDDWDVVLSARHDDHDDVGRAVTRRVASGWRLNDNLAVRGAWSSAEKAPFLAGLHAGTVTLAERIFDPQAGFRYGVETHNVGNPKLRPDRAENIGLGVVGTRGGVTLSADWYRTRLSRMLAYVSTQAAIDHAHATGSPPGDIIIHRHPALGFITQVNKTLLTDGKAEISGFDVRLQWDRPTAWADFGVDVHWSRMTRYEFHALGIKQPIDYAKDRVHATIRATRGDVTVQWAAYGLSSYRTEDGRYGSWIGHDLSLRWRDAFGFEGANLTAGVLNLADRSPATNPGDPDYPDERLDSIRGRTLFLTFVKAW